MKLEIKTREDFDLEYRKFVKNLNIEEWSDKDEKFVTEKWVSVESLKEFLRDLINDLSDWNNTTSDKVKQVLKKLEEQ